MVQRAHLAEVLGTFWLVFGGCGTAVLAGSHVGWNGVALAFGLTVLTMAYAVGHVSGCHLNPAVTLGLATAGRFPKAQVAGYVLAQVVGAVLAALAVLAIAKGLPGGYDPVAAGLASNGFGERSPKGFSLLAGFLAEVLGTFFFVLVILGVTAKKASPGFAGMAIGLALTLVHLITIPVTNTSVNPARSTGPALFAGAEAIGQLWLFWVAPLLGAVVAGSVGRTLFAERGDGA